MTGYPFQGASGQYYDFALVQLPAVPMLSGIFIFAEMVQRNPNWAGFEPETIYIGEAESIYREITTTTLWNIARASHGATLIYVRPRPNAETRRKERDDLVARYRPPMNMEGDGPE
jgi:hypothetical protein